MSLNFFLFIAMQKILKPITVVEKTIKASLVLLFFFISVRFLFNRS